MDAMWSFVGKKKAPRWRWHAIDHTTGAVLAYVFGRRKDEVFLQWKALLEPVGLTRFYTDHWGAYTRHLEPDVPSPGKRNTQNIERKHLTLRTRIKRLVRKTICFSKSTPMHDIVIGLFVHRYAVGRAVQKWPSPLLEHYPQFVTCGMSSTSSVWRCCTLGRAAAPASADLPGAANPCSRRTHVV